jgi:hypothetical protein
MTEAMLLLLLVVSVGAGCFWAGWCSAASYLHAARAVSDVTNAVAAQSNDFTSTLDKATAEAASLRVAVDNLGGVSLRNSQAVEAKLGDVEGAMVTLFQGFERAGLVRSSRPAPGRQVGEAGPE